MTRSNDLSSLISGQVVPGTVAVNGSIIVANASGNNVTINSNGTIAAAAFSGAGLGFSNMRVFTGPGTFTAPPSTTKVKVTVVGGGGGGSSGATGAGGGSGATSSFSNSSSGITSTGGSGTANPSVAAAGGTTTISGHIACSAFYSGGIPGLSGAYTPFGQEGVTYSVGGSNFSTGGGLGAGGGSVSEVASLGKLGGGSGGVGIALFDTTSTKIWNVAVGGGGSGAGAAQSTPTGGYAGVNGQPGSQGAMAGGVAPPGVFPQPVGGGGGSGAAGGSSGSQISVLAPNRSQGQSGSTLTSKNASGYAGGGSVPTSVDYTYVTSGGGGGIVIVEW